MAMPPATIDRDLELGRLGAALDAADEGRGATVVLEGPAGVGKSHLLACAAALATARGTRVLGSRGTALGAAASFGVVLDLLSELVDPLREGAVVPAALRPLLESEGPVPEDGDEMVARASFALAQLCRSAAASRPLALLVDDAQWADPPSLDVLAAISSLTETAPIILIVAVRSGERVMHPEALALLRGEPPARLLRVRELSPQGVGKLLELCGVERAEEAFVTACAELTGGNPFLVTLVAGLLRESGLPAARPSLDSVAAEGADAVASTIAPRLRRLGPLAERLTVICSVLGTEAESRRVAALAEVELDERFAATIDGLAAAGVLAPGEPLLFAHPLVREAVYHSLPAAARGREHAATAQLLADEDADPELVASHLLRAPPAHSHETIEQLSEASDQALRRGVPASAVKYLERALAEPATGEDRVRLLLRLGYAEGLLGGPGAERRFREARLLSASPVLRAEADLRLGRSLYAGGDFGAAERSFELGLTEVGSERSGLATELHAGALAAGRYAGSLGHDDPRLTAVSGDSFTGATRAERSLLSELAVQAGFRGEPCEQVISLALRAWADGEMLTSSDCQAITISQVGAALVWSGAYEEADRVLSMTARHAEETGARVGCATVRYARGWARLFRGDLVAATEDLEGALATEGWEMYGPPARAALAHVWIDRAELAAAAAALTPADTGDAWGEAVPLAMVLEARGRLAALNGDFAGALKHLEACGELLGPMGDHVPLSQWRLRTALCLHHLGNSTDARALLERELAAASATGSPRLLGMALAALGAVVGGEDGLKHLREADSTLANSSARLAHARVLADLGTHLRRLGRDREARDSLRAALAAAHAMGATLIAQRAAGELTAAGWPHSPTTGEPSARSPVEGPAANQRGARLGFAHAGEEATGAIALEPLLRDAGLSRREVEVFAVLAEGVPNAEIAGRLHVSPHTVKRHLENVYAKLGVGSRTEALAYLLRAGGGSRGGTK